MRRGLILALSFVFIATLGLAQSDPQQPTLADIARQKSGKKAVRVVTNDEIPPRPDLSPSDPVPAPKAETKPAAAAAAPAAPPAGDSPAVKAARAKLADAQAKETSVADQVKAATAAQAAASSADRQITDNILQEKRKFLEDAQAERAAAEKELADLLAAGGGAATASPSASGNQLQKRVDDLKAREAELNDQVKTAEDAVQAADSTQRPQADRTLQALKASLAQVQSDRAAAEKDLADAAAQAAKAPGSPQN